jgi:hypothetical protein
MKRISLEDASPGMILAQKIVREDGVLLAQKGAELTDPMLRMLQRLNFEYVIVEEEFTETSEERAERLSKEEAEIEARFARVKDDPILKHLKTALLKRVREEH